MVDVQQKKVDAKWPRFLNSDEEQRLIVLGMSMSAQK